MKSIRLITLLICLIFLMACFPFSLFKADTAEILVTEISTENSIDVESTPLTPDDTSELQPLSQNEFGESARVHLEVLAGEIGDRLAGTGNETSAAEYIKSQFEAFGYTAETQWFTAYDDYEGVSFDSSNIIAVKQGRSDKQIIVGAHYDSVNDDGSQGADDNASGVAVLLETAERVFDEETPYTIVFVAFGAEEVGLWGSANYVDELNQSERKSIIGMVNLDSLIAGDKAYVYGNEGRGSMRDWVLENAKQKGIRIEGKTDEDLYYEDGTPCECSDFDAFEKVYIPYVFFEATNWDLSSDGMVQVNPQYGVNGEIRHTEFDTIEYIDETFPGRIEDHLNTFVTLLFNLLTQY
jgi:hypothetical protein